MHYIANPVDVEAEVIIAVGPVLPNGSLDVSLNNEQTFRCNPGMIARYIPRPGDYLVTQADGYIYLNPKEVFERKYRRDNVPAARTMS